MPQQLAAKLTASAIQNRIILAKEQTERNYLMAVRELRELKTRLNDAERIIVDDVNGDTAGARVKLDSTIDRLIKFADSMISESERAWDEYRTLEQDCKFDTSSNVNDQMKTLKELCEKTDAFATDLLCYSLGRFNRSNRHPNLP